MSDRDLGRLWADLAGTDGPKAYRAAQRLADDPARAVPFLRRHLRAVAADPQVERWIADLDSPTFAARQRASRGLEGRGEAARAALRGALARNPSAEVRRRLRRLLEKLEDRPIGPDELRQFRAVAALEYANTTGAREVLRTLAGGLSAARLTREAKVSLNRLSHRPATADRQ